MGQSQRVFRRGGGGVYSGCVEGVCRAIYCANSTPPLPILCPRVPFPILCPCRYVALAQEAAQSPARTDRWDRQLTAWHVGTGVCAGNLTVGWTASMHAEAGV